MSQSNRGSACQYTCVVAQLYLPVMEILKSRRWCLYACAALLQRKSRLENVRAICKEEEEEGFNILASQQGCVDVAGMSSLVRYT